MINYNLNKKSILLILFVFFGMTSCDDTLDINESPNNPGESTPELTLPAGMLFSGQTVGLDFAILSGFMAQYWTQSPEAGQYERFDRYNFNATATSAGWSNSWSGALADYNYVRIKGLEDGLSNHAAVATIMMAYQFQVLNDLFDDIPVDDALKGDQGILQPEYQTGPEVYDRLIELVDEGISYIIPGSITPESGDLIFGGDMEMWRKFANTLKLKIYMRQSEVRPDVARQGVTGLLASGVEFLGSGEDVFLQYFDGVGNQNPLYAGDVSTEGLGNNNITASDSVINRMLTAGDPRVDFYYDPSVDLGVQVGAQQGSQVEEQGTDDREDFSTPDAVNVAGPSTPVYFMTGHESLFLQAEAAARGWGGGTPRSVYDEAMRAAFLFAGGHDASGFVADGGAYAYSGIDDIYFQKWMSMAGTQCVEGWAELRRTDVPQLEQSVVGTGASLGGSKFPRRAFYPISEEANNPNTPSNTNIGEPVWWDVSE